MNTFGAKVDFKVHSSNDIQYCLVQCQKVVTEEQLIRIASFIRSNSLQQVFNSVDQKIWVVALKTEQMDQLRRFGGIKLVGGINIDPKKLLGMLKPVVVDKS